MNISILGLRSRLKICLILSSSGGVFIPPPPTRISRDAISHFLVEGFQWNSPLIFTMWLGTAGKLFKVRGQMWTKMCVFHWRRHTSRSVASAITFYLLLRPSCPRTRRVYIAPDFIYTIQYNAIEIIVTVVGSLQLERGRIPGSLIVRLQLSAIRHKTPSVVFKARSSPSSFNLSNRHNDKIDSVQKQSLRHRKAVHSTNTWPVVQTVNATDVSVQSSADSTQWKTPRHSMLQWLDLRGYSEKFNYS